MRWAELTLADGEENAQTAEYLHLLGRSLAELDELADAEAMLARAVAAKTAASPAGHVRLVASGEALRAVRGARTAR